MDRKQLIAYLNNTYHDHNKYNIKTWVQSTSYQFDSAESIFYLIAERSHFYWYVIFKITMLIIKITMLIIKITMLIFINNVNNWNNNANI